MNEKVAEALLILQEECAEVIQAVSKVNRFGVNNYNPGNPKTNREHLEEEIGDMLAMVDILVEQGIIDPTVLNTAKTAKKDKLKKWSKLYE